MLKILVLCTANICRSPMAEHLLKAALRDYDVHIESAGINGAYATRADEMVVQMLKSEGIEGVEAIENHLSKPVSQLNATDFDLILCMERHHLEDLQRLIPQATGRTFLMGHWQGEEIEDPHGLDQSEYLRALAQIQLSIDYWKRNLSDMGLLQ